MKRSRADIKNVKGNLSLWVNKEKTKQRFSNFRGRIKVEEIVQMPLSGVDTSKGDKNINFGSSWGKNPI